MSYCCQGDHRHHCNDCSLSSTLNYPLPRSSRLFLSYNGRLFSPSFSLPVEVIIVVPQPLAEHSSLTCHWFWTEMIKQVDHGWWTSTVRRHCLEQTYTPAKTVSQHALPSQCKAKRQIPPLFSLSK